MRRAPLLLALLTAWLLASCTAAPDVPTHALQPTATPVPTATSGLALPPTPTVTAIPTPTPSPKALATPTGEADAPPTVSVGQGTFAVEVADDTAERAVGLSGRDSLPTDAGMWFAYLNAHQPSFWMRGMRFAIDIVWIDSSLHVVDVTHNAPAPPDNATLDELPLYTPSAPIMYVLEINEGLARDMRIESGALVTLANVE